ncbi:MAG: hypothetical protein ABFS02_14690, partial [Pseudomonadota bacterium]
MGNNTPLLQIYGGELSARAGKETVRYVDGFDPLSKGEWTFIAGVWDFDARTLLLRSGSSRALLSNRPMDLESDGISQRTFAAPNSEESAEQPYVLIGAKDIVHFGSATPPAIDNVRIYRRALTDDELDYLAHGSCIQYSTQTPPSGGSDASLPMPSTDQELDGRPQGPCGSYEAPVAVADVESLGEPSQQEPDGTTDPDLSPDIGNNVDEAGVLPELFGDPDLPPDIGVDSIIQQDPEPQVPLNYEQPASEESDFPQPIEGVSDAVAEMAESSGVYEGLENLEGTGSGPLDLSNQSSGSGSTVDATGITTSDTDVDYNAMQSELERRRQIEEGKRERQAMEDELARQQNELEAQQRQEAADAEAAAEAEAAANAEGTSTTSSGTTTTRTQTLTEKPTYKAVGDDVMSISRSGYAGGESYRIDLATRFIRSIEWSEVFDKPCRIGVREKGAIKERNNCHDHDGPVAWSRHEVRLAEPIVAIRSLRVCNNNNRKHRMKGIQIWGAVIDKNGAREDMPETTSEYTNNCDEWGETARCPNGKL